MMAAAGFPQPPSAVMDMKTSEASQRTERGASAVEYGLLIAAVAAVLVIVIIALGVGVFGLFDDSCNSLAEQSGETC
jgi:pilus assembly protein Flp/PilA